MKLNKKLAILSVVTSAIICSTAFAETVNGGKITFNGEVTSGACAVTGSDTDKIVALDTVRAKTFTAADQLGNAKKSFDITLVDCDNTTLKLVQISFNGQTVDGTPNLLANTAGAGSAQNVGLQLFGPDGAELNIGEFSSEINLADSTIIPLSVDYKSTSADVVAGKVQSVANFQLDYN